MVLLKYLPEGGGPVGGRAADDDDDPVGCRSPMEALTAFNESSLLLKVLDLDPERSLAVPVASEAEVGALKLLTPESGDNRCWPETKKNISSTIQVCLFVGLPHGGRKWGVVSLIQWVGFGLSIFVETGLNRVFAPID